MFDVALQHIWVAPRQRLAAINCAMRAFAWPTGVGVGVKAWLPHRRKHGVQRVMDNPIPKVGGTDQAAFAVFGNDKRVIGLMLVGARCKLVL